MKVRMGEIAEGGRTFAGELPVEAIDWGPPDEVTVVAPVRYRLHATRIPGTLLINGSLATTVECRCRRCDQPFRREVVDPEFVRAWELSPDGLQWRRRLEDEGVEPVHKHFDDKALQEPKTAGSDADSVDLTDDMREAIILAFPRYPVCRPECRGLCGRCGKNLNIEACTCTPLDDNRWTALDKLGVQ